MVSVILLPCMQCSREDLLLLRGLVSMTLVRAHQQRWLCAAVVVCLMYVLADTYRQIQSHAGLNHLEGPGPQEIEEIGCGVPDSIGAGLQGY